jgi:hypothetical protein
LTVAAVVALGVDEVRSQSRPERSGAGTAWTQKTPWGDPDLSGPWTRTSDDMRGIPRGVIGSILPVIYGNGNRISPVAARGHFEGGTLVVEATNVTDQTSVGGNGNGPRHSDALTLTERFTRLDSQTLEYVVTWTIPGPTCSRS